MESGFPQDQSRDLRGLLCLVFPLHSTLWVLWGKTGKKPHEQHKITPWSIHGNPSPLLYPRPGDSRAFSLAVFSQNLWVINSEAHSFSWTFLAREKMVFCQQSERDPLALGPLAAPTGPSGGSGGGFPHFMLGSTGDTQDNFSLGGRRERAASTEIRGGKKLHCWTWGMAEQIMIPRDRFCFVICPPQVFPSCLNKSPLAQLILFQPLSSSPASTRAMSVFDDAPRSKPGALAMSSKSGYQ